VNFDSVGSPPNIFKKGDVNSNIVSDPIVKDMLEVNMIFGSQNEQKKDPTPKPAQLYFDDVSFSVELTRR
jgi:hypothetical protein